MFLLEKRTTRRYLGALLQYVVRQPSEHIRRIEDHALFRLCLCNEALPGVVIGLALSPSAVLDLEAGEVRVVLDEFVIL